MTLVCRSRRLSRDLLHLPDRDNVGSTRRKAGNLLDALRNRQWCTGLMKAHSESRPKPPYCHGMLLRGRSRSYVSLLPYTPRQFRWLPVFCCCVIKSEASKPMTLRTYAVVFVGLSTRHSTRV